MGRESDGVEMKGEGCLMVGESEELGRECEGEIGVVGVMEEDVENVVGGVMGEELG